MHGRLAGWFTSAARVSRIRIAIWRMPATSASCEQGMGSRARRVFTAGGAETVIVGRRAESACIAASTPCLPSPRAGRGPAEGGDNRAGGGTSAAGAPGRTGPGRSSGSGPVVAAGAAMVSAHSRHSASLTHQVSAGATMSTRSLITSVRKVVGSRSAPRQGSAVSVISAPCPFRVFAPGRIETGIRSRLSA